MDRVEAEFEVAPLTPFGATIDYDLSRPLDAEAQRALREVFAEHKLLVFRGQVLDEDAQVRALGTLGRVLGSKGEYRQISSDGNLGSGPLAYHSDLAFTEEPFKILSLHALAVNDGQSWTRFASGIRVLEHLSPDLQAAIAGRDALTVISIVQSHRAVDFDPPEFLPQQRRPLVIPHPSTGEPILYISEMQTARIEGLAREDSDALLEQLFAALYAPSNVYEHRWNQGDLVIWDNIALQHARCDLTGMSPRVLQRVAVADKSFFDLCPQFDLGDPKVEAWASGQSLQMT